MMLAWELKEHHGMRAKMEKSGTNMKSGNAMRKNNYTNKRKSKNKSVVRCFIFTNKEAESHVILCYTSCH